jgi:DNA ligase-1
MQFSDLSLHLTKLEGTSSRIEMTKILAELFKQLKGIEIEQVSYILEGQLVPQYLSLEFQLSIKMLLRALARIQSQQPGELAESSTLFGE